MSFQIHALPRESFAHLFGLSDADLAAVGARRETVTSRPGFPCRISLKDAEFGETVILTHFTHHDTSGPYRASHAVFVSDAPTATPMPGQVPDVLRSRRLSVRAYGKDAAMLTADVIEGIGLASWLDSTFEDDRVAYVHIHNAAPGCFAASATRA